jgi:hypothetical protein
LLGSGERLSVQLMNSARRPVKSYAVSVMGVDPSASPRATPEAGVPRHRTVRNPLTVEGAHR